MLVIGTAGHVDHGKSTLVAAITGMEPDRLTEERARGLTIDLGYAWTEIANGDEVAFVDVPGHSRFTRNMLAGAGLVDACLFVVSATEGWMPQSEEHLRILQLLQVPPGIVVLTKCDLVDEAMLELVRDDVADHVADTFLARAPVVEVDALTGRGIEELRRQLAEIRPGPGTADLGRPRLWIDRSFVVRGSGTVVTGTLTGGALVTDERLTLLPAGREVRVRSLQSLGRAAESVPPGSRVAANLSQVPTSLAARGSALVHSAQWRPSRVVDVSLSVLGSLKHEVAARGAYVVHVGTADLPARLRVLGTSSLEPGATGAARLHLSAELPLIPGDRYVLREQGRGETVGGGEVLDVAPVLRASRARPSRSVDRIVAERGWVVASELEALTGLPASATLGQWVVSPASLKETVERVRQKVLNAGSLGLDLAVLDERERAVLSTLDDFRVEGGRVRDPKLQDPLIDHPFVHALEASPFMPAEPQGVPPAELRELVRSGRVVKQDGIWFAASAMEEAAHRVARLLRERPGGLSVAEIRDALGTTRRFALPILNYLDNHGITRRQDDARVAGPYLPDISQ